MSDLSRRTLLRHVPVLAPTAGVLALSVLVPSVLVLAACGGGGGGGSPQASTAAVDPARSTVVVPQVAGIPNDGISGAAFRITLRDANGQPIDGRAVAVEASGSENTFLPAPRVVTDPQGAAVVRLTSTRAEQKRVRVQADSVPGAASIVVSDIEVEFGVSQVARRRVSVDSSGAEANDFSGHAAVSGNGRWVAFMAKADNLVPGDTNEKEDVFVHDLVARTTERVSLLPTGAQFGDLCGKPSLSDDGGLVAFMGRQGDTDAVWVRDRIARSTEPISDATTLNGRCFDPSISGDGRFVAFVNDNGEQIQVYLFDRVTRALELVSRNDAGQPGNGPSRAPSVSRDGRWIAFASEADNLVGSDSNEKIDVFVRDRSNGTTRLVSRSASGALGDDDSVEASIAADGRYVAFASKAENLVPDDDNGKSDVFVVDRVTGAIERASVDATGREVDKESWLPRLSADGAFVAFASLSDDLVAEDRNGKEDVFVRDLPRGAIRRVSLALGSADPNDDCTAPALAADAPVVAFTAKAQNMVPSDGNDQPDVFVAPRD